MSVKATGRGQEVEVPPGHPLNGSASGGAASGFRTRLPPQTGRGKSDGPEPERALKGPAADTARPCWGCLHPTWMNRGP